MLNKKMKKALVFIIILFVVVGLTGIIYFIPSLNNKNLENNYSKNIEPQVNDLKNTPSENVEPQVNDLNEVNQTNNLNLNVETFYSLAEVQKHNSKESCWSIVRGEVYDLTSWIANHPGGEKAILNICGKDGTKNFENKHGGKTQPEETLKKFRIGKLYQ
jgi:cytochrome b involved in lipid metabolism